MILTKYVPIKVKYGLGVIEHDAEGRILTLEFPTFFIVWVYTPHLMVDWSRIEYRIFEWDVAVREHCEKLKSTGKYVIVAGDFNVCHEPIDIHNPEKSEWGAGYTFYERTSFSKLLRSGFADTYRLLNPDTANYTWWSNIGNNLRNKNLGRRYDYILIDDRIKDSVIQSDIYNHIKGSDHCPIMSTIDLNIVKAIQDKQWL